MYVLYVCDDVRVIKKINRRTAVAVEETLTGALSAYGLTVYIAAGEFELSPSLLGLMAVTCCSMR